MYEHDPPPNLSLPDNRLDQIELSARTRLLANAGDAANAADVLVLIREIGILRGLLKATRDEARRKLEKVRDEFRTEVYEVRESTRKRVAELTEDYSSVVASQVAEIEQLRIKAAAATSRGPFAACEEEGCERVTEPGARYCHLHLPAASRRGCNPGRTAAGSVSAEARMMRRPSRRGRCPREADGGHGGGNSWDDVIGILEGDRS